MEAVKIVHKVNNYKKQQQFLIAYRNASGMSPGLSGIIDRMVKDSKVCKKFKRSVATPRVALQKSTSFNEIVTLNLKEFGSKYVLWMVDSFTRFMEGRLISNMKADTMINTVNDSWCLNVGFPSI